MISVKDRLMHIQYVEQYFAFYGAQMNKIYVPVHTYLPNSVIGHTVSIHVPGLLKFWPCYRKLYMLAPSDCKRGLYFVYILFEFSSQ